MCFSPPASFAVAAVSTVIGLAALRHVNHRRDFPLAAVPLIFAIQQMIEGLLWLQLLSHDAGSGVYVLSFIFLIFAEVVWPVYSPLAALLVEPEHRRRRMLAVFAVAGAMLSVYLLAGLLAAPPAAEIRHNSIAYSNEVAFITWRFAPYVLCTCGPLLLSSHRTIQVLGLVVLIGFLVSAYHYAVTFVSVWCFFAAASSALIYFYFRRADLAVRVHYP